MNEHKIKLFLEDLYRDILPHGDISRIEDFYCKDVVGHQNNRDFYLADIKQRFELFRQYLKAFTFKISNFLVLNDLVFVSVYQQWLAKPNDEFFEAILPIVFRFKEGKIGEIWSLVDKSIGTYQMQNADLKLSWQLFSVSEKTKRNFISRLVLSQYFTNKTHSRCSKIEQECLFYYLHGFSAKETASILNLSPRTIESHIVNVKAKLDCHNKNELRKKLFAEK